MNCSLQNVKYLEQSVWFCMLLEGSFISFCCCYSLNEWVSNYWKTPYKRLLVALLVATHSFGLPYDSHVPLQMYILSIIFLFSLFNEFLSQNKAKPDVFHLVKSAVAQIFCLLTYVFFFCTGKRGMQAPECSPCPTTEFKAVFHQSFHPSSHSQTCTTADALS